MSSPEAKLQMNTTSAVVYARASRDLAKMSSNEFGSVAQAKKSEVARKIEVLEESLKEVEALLLKGTPCFKLGEKCLMEIRTKIELSLLEMQNSNVATAAVCDNYIKAHNKNKTQPKSSHAELDLYSILQLFLHSAYRQTLTQKQLGLYIAEYVDCAEAFEREKLHGVKKAIGGYLSFLQEGYQSAQGGYL